MIKAVIFDMDGLLMDSEPLWAEAMDKIFAELGVPIEKMAKQTMGFRINEIIDYWFSYFSLKNASKKETQEKLTKQVIQLIEDRGEPKKGAKEIVELFADQNMPMAIASSSQGKIIDAVLEKLSIRQYLKVVYSAENEPYGKPHPGVYITAAKKLNINPEQCLTFEDSPNGVLAAKAAKMKCIVVPDQIAKDNKIFCIADMIIDSLEDFRLDYLDRF